MTRHLSFLVQYYDLPSLMAGKLHALLTRRYAKGRDWYDLVWYLSQRPPVTPNLAMLQNALDQTQGAHRVDARHWRQEVMDRLAAMDIPMPLPQMRIPQAARPSSIHSASRRA